MTKNNDIKLICKVPCQRSMKRYYTYLS